MDTQVQSDTQEKDYPNRRRPWTAVFLSLISPGLGHIYCGAIKSGIVVMGIVAVFWSAFMLGLMHPQADLLPLSLITWGIESLVSIFAAIDAFRRARRTRFDYQLKEYNHWALYLLLCWITGFGSIGILPFFKSNMFHAFHITTNSMAPTILVGDRAIANKMSYNFKNPEYGDVVLYKDPEDRKGSCIQRVVGLAGDTVEVKDGQLLINAKVLKRDFVQEKTIYRNGKPIKGDVFWEDNSNARYQVFISKEITTSKPMAKDFGPVTVPPYHCFVIGDNRNYSDDSRNFGSLAYGELKGRFTQIYWPIQHQKRLNAKQ